MTAHDPDEAIGISFRDVLFLSIGLFVFITFIFSFFVRENLSSRYNFIAPGDVVFEVRWKDNVDVDVDLWVEAPECRPIGYSNRADDFVDLLRDDRGEIADDTGKNFEYAFTRGIKAGEYVVNVHLFRSGTPGVLPMRVDYRIFVIRGATREIVDEGSVLLGDKEEKTISRFELTEGGKLVPGTKNKVFKPLREEKL